MTLVKYGITDWIAENRADFVPPVCNKCLFSDQLKAFLVGGPNIRKDFHLEEGEEFFYMIDGDMCLRTVNENVVKDVKILQGQIYMQPGRILHSPQRQANTVGLVVERSRALHELDSLRYFTDEKTLDVSFERWFHMKDAVADLPPIINEYFQQQAKLLQTSPGPKCPQAEKAANRPYEADNDAKLEKPIFLKEWIDSNSDYLKKHGRKQVYGPPRFSSTINVYGSGQHNLVAEGCEIFVWFLQGAGSIEFNAKEYIWNAVETTLIPIGSRANVVAGDASYFFTVEMPTPQ